MDKRKTGILIKEARTKKGYTQSELGDLLGVTNKAVSRWENGESFPDIGVLENLSQIIEVSIQDLVVGERQSDSNEAVGEIVRIAKTQAKHKARRVYAGILAGCILIYSLMIGLMGTSGFPIGNSSQVLLGIPFSLAVILLVWLYGCIRQKEEIIPHKKTLEKTILIISVITMAWIIVMVNVAVAMAENGVAIFGIALSKLGPFLNSQLIIVFWINFVLLMIAFYRIIKQLSGLHAGIAISYAAIHLVALYGDALYRMSTVEAASVMLLARTVVILLEIFAAVVAAAILRRRKKI